MRRQGRSYAAQRIWRVLRREVIVRDGGRCLNCGTTENLTVDHITPRSKGGPDEAYNLRTLCRPCHDVAQPAWTAKPEPKKEARKKA